MKHISLSLIALTLVGAVAVTAPAATREDNRSLSVVVISDRGAGAALEAVQAVGGDTTSRIDLIGAVVATVGSPDVAALEARAGISVSPDRELTVEDASYSGTPSNTYPASIGATHLWKQGLTGKGVGVALLDTGVAPHADLQGRVAASVDLTTEGTFSDSYGHGTFLAGLIAGNGASSQGRFTGVAPDAHLMSVKVAGADGVTTLGQVLYGLQLIDSAKERYNIKVVTIALAGPAVSGPDPLVLAVERLWADGLVVVAAAGNTGATNGTIASPAVDPYILTVGSTDEQGTSSVDDDTIPDWSARGPSVYSLPKPDAVIPGKSLVSLRAVGSTSDLNYPGARIADAYFRGSGTSMSAAVGAGAAALLLQSDPSLTPNEVKGRMMGTATSLPGADPHAWGAGAIDIAAAVSSDAPAANGDLPALPQGGAVVAPADPFAGARETTTFDWRPSQDGVDRWAARGWAARGWANADWSARGWAARGWAGKVWAARGWAGQMWANADWSARGWAGATWAGVRWENR